MLGDEVVSTDFDVGARAVPVQRHEIAPATSTAMLYRYARLDLCWSIVGSIDTLLVMVTAHGFLYEHLADELGQAIDRGTLRAGDRLPSVRRLAQERSVSVSTVLEAYLQLENAGLIEVRPKSGHFVRRRAMLTAEPRTPRICQRPSLVTVSDAYTKILTAMRDPELVPFGCATVDPTYLPIAQLNPIRSQPVHALVVAPTVSSPLGSIMPEAERDRLVRITRSADIPIIEDDVYGELVFDGTRPRPLRAFASPSEDSHVLHVSSVSKTL